MTPRRVLTLLLGYAAALSAALTYLEVREIAEPYWVTVGTAIIYSLLIFWWYWLDSQRRSYRRSPLLSIAIVAVSFVAVPYYLVRSRAKGERLKAIGRLFGFVALLIVAMLAGGMPGIWFSGVI